ncbi:MAG: galactose mutarotase [Ignavibacteriae bacterium]|nr:galactose mutarotase [Ignavibacteriota bacterium]
MKIEKEFWGYTKKSESVDLFTLTNKNGTKIKISNYGGIIQSLFTQNKNGKFEDIVLGYDNLESYLDKTPYFGCICGRYSNRINKSSFIIDGTKYNLSANEGDNHLHGGFIGFDKVVWNAKEIQNENEVGVELNYLSGDGEEGFPGNLNATVKYFFTNENELIIEYSATTDKSTHVCLTNHTYFNLSGNLNNSILDHQLWIDADKYIPIDNLAIPSGEINSVIETPFDFTKSTKIGKRIDEHNTQLINGFGYDHCFAFKNFDGNLKPQANLFEENSGRFIEMFTTEPAVQLYTGNHLDESFIGKNGIAYKKRTGVCLETEHFPDSPNNLNFPSTLLKPGEVYSSKTVYKFKTISY